MSGIACNLRKLLEADALHLVNEKFKKLPASCSVRDVLYLNFVLGLCLEDVGKTEMLMKVLTRCLESRPGFAGRGLLDFLFWLISFFHIIYFSLSTAERCFFLALFSNVFEKILINMLLQQDEAVRSTKFKNKWFGSLDSSLQQQCC